MANFGAATELVGGTLQLKLPSRCNFWFIQNQSGSPLKVTFLSGDWGQMTSIILVGAAFAGAPGGYLDSIGFPYFGEQGVQLSSTDPTAAFGSGASPCTPNNTFIYPGVGPSGGFS